MTMDTFASFVKDLVLLHSEWKRGPFVLFIGNGATPELRTTLVRKVVEMHGLSVRDISTTLTTPTAPTTCDPENVFHEIWRAMPRTIRNALFWSALSAAKSTFPTETKKAIEGFGHLAELVGAGYFDMIVTTRADCLLETALQRVLEFHEWRVFRVGIDPIQEILEHIVPAHRRTVSVVKLRGDAAREIYPLGQELFDEMLAVAKPLFAKPMLLVGYDDNSDKDIRPALKLGTQLYFAATAAPEAGSQLEDVLKHADPKFIVGDALRFDGFFRRLVATLIGGESDGNAAMLANGNFGQSKLPIEKSDGSTHSSAQPTKDSVEILRAGHQAAAPANDAVVSFPRRVIITLSIDSRSRRIMFRSEGDLIRTGTAEIPDPLDAEFYNSLVRSMGDDLQRARAEGDKVGRDAWRTKQIWEGRRLHASLVQRIPELGDLLGTAQGVTLDGGDLMICFDGTRHMLGMPYELLQDESGPWALRYAMFRSVQKVNVRGQSFRRLVDELKARREQLRVLVVGSDSPPYLGIAEHVQRLTQALEARASKLQIPIAVEPLVLGINDDAMAQLKERLPAGGYHVLCYEGHSAQSGEPGKTGLVIGSHGQIWNEQHLQAALRQAAPRLVFLNSCVGARIGGGHLLHDRDHLGMMDAAVQAGVPVVLGYRWSVLDSAAARFGRVFMEKLLETRSPPLAVLHARADAYRLDTLDETWSSPILVAQQVD
jgi:hypothetical protein